MAKRHQQLREKLHDNRQVIAPTTRSEDHRNIYVDTSKIGLSPWDFRFTFGLLLEPSPAKSANEEQVTVIMSPQHAKTFLRILGDNLKTWEDEFGVINDPLDVEAETDTQESSE